MAALSQRAVQSWLEDDVVYMASVAPAAPLYQIPIRQVSTCCSVCF